MALFKSDKQNTKADKKAIEPKSMKDMYADENKAKTDKKSDQAAVSRAYRILLRPLVSEKASHQQTLANQYFFAVAKDANKIEVASAVKAAYGVAPVKVNMIRMEGKSRMYGRNVGKRKDWKKAVVTLPKGKTITLYEGV